MFFGTISESDRLIFAFSAAPPSGVMTVDASYCAAHGLAAFDGACITEALLEAEEFDGAIGVVEIAPGKPLRVWVPRVRLIASWISGLTSCLLVTHFGLLPCRHLRWLPRRTPGDLSRPSARHIDVVPQPTRQWQVRRYFLAGGARCVTCGDRVTNCITHLFWSLFRCRYRQSRRRLVM